jgi:hypothetical protein
VGGLPFKWQMNVMCSPFGVGLIACSAEENICSVEQENCKAVLVVWVR